MEIYFKVKHTVADDQVPTVLLAVGEEGLRRYNCWELTSVQQRDVKTIFEKFTEQLEPQENFRVCRLKLAKTMQQPKEKLDDFVNRCRQIAIQCAFSKEELDERLIEQIIASTPIPDFQKDLLTKKAGFTLYEALQLGTTHEASDAHVQALQSLYNEAHVDAMQSSQTQSTCKNCGGRHPYGKQHCPAAGVQCHLCKKQGHHTRVCLTTKLSKGQGHHKAKAQSKGKPKTYRGQKQSAKTGNTKQMHDIDHDVEDQPEFEELAFDTIDSGRRESVTTSFKIKLDNRKGTHNLTAKVDTRAQANTLPVRTYRRMFPERILPDGTPNDLYLSQDSSMLTAYNGTQIQQHGKVTIPCQWNDSPWIDTSFYVVNSEGPVIMGLQSSMAFNLITLHCPINDVPIEDVNTLLNAFPDQFDTIGNFQGEQHLKTDPNVPSRRDAPRKMPIALKDCVRQELNRMEAQGVIKKMEEPTEWVNSITYATKKDGSIRICLDPRRPNQALIRPHYKQQTLEELNYKFHNAQFFSKLDAKAGYWSIKPDQESQKLTTFQTPFGRYAFCRLPFGLNVSQDIFQLEIDRILEGCTGTVCIADDIVVYGMTAEEHDRNLLKLMQTAKERGLTFNSSKCHIKQRSITFFGNVYTCEGIKPDPQKVADLQAVPPHKTSQISNISSE
ncbi:uncharacterized protein [Diadema setosum]|uniref:uncharacterized protein n=1 Tax=Diadema setosum TaxID=31175 RepID=UPI003B3BD95C